MEVDGRHGIQTLFGKSRRQLLVVHNSRWCQPHAAQTRLREREFGRLSPLFAHAAASPWNLESSVHGSVPVKKLPPPHDRSMPAATRLPIVARRLMTGWLAGRSSYCPLLHPHPEFADLEARVASALPWRVRVDHLEVEAPQQLAVPNRRGTWLVHHYH